MHSCVLFFLTLYQEERWRASINLSSYQWAWSRSNQDSFVPLCVSLCRCYHFSLCSSLLCLQHLPLSPLLRLWFWHVVLSLSLSRKALQHQWNKNPRAAVTPVLHAAVMHDCINICYVMSRVHWHGTQQIITSSLMATSRFSQRRNGTWEGVEFKV